MNEITALEYLKAKARMTERCTIDCIDCEFTRLIDHTRNNGCENFIGNNPEKAIEIVEKWAKENPAKTYKDILLEKYPDVRLNEKGLPCFCMQVLYPNKKCSEAYFVCHNNCWNEEYQEPRP